MNRYRPVIQMLEHRITPVDLDPMFGSDGLINFIDNGTDFGINISSYPAAYTSDGFIYLQSSPARDFPPPGFNDPGISEYYDPGLRVTVIRLTPQGELDATFDGNGLSDPLVNLPLNTRDFAAFAEPIALADRSVAVKVSITRFPDNDGRPDEIGFVRLTADGAFDTEFGDNGFARFPDTGMPSQINATTDFTYVDRSYASPDGGIVTVGQRADGTVVVTKLMSNGQLDANFGQEGIARHLLLPGASRQILRAAAVDSQGQVILGGDVVTGEVFQSEPTGTYHFPTGVIVRLDSSGSLDQGFAKEGRYTRLLGNPDIVNSFNNRMTDRIAVRHDGTIIATGVISVGLGGHGFSILQLKPDGTPDEDFGARDGMASYQIEGFISDMMLLPLPDARTIIAGSQSITNVSGTTLSLLMIDTDGTIDRSFGVNGTAALTPRGNQAGVYYGGSLGQLSDNTIVVKLSGFIAAYDLNLPTPANTKGFAVSEFLPPDPSVEPFGGNPYKLSADLTGDGRPEIIEIAAPGGRPRVRILDGAMGTVLVDEDVYESTFDGGLFAAIADFNNDGKFELVVSPDVGGGARVRVLTPVNGKLEALDDFFAIEDPNFRGGARVTTGDVNGDGVAELIVGAGFGGGPRVAIFKGQGLLQGQTLPEKLIGDFLAFPGADAVNLRNGVFLSAGDLDGDGQAELSFGGGPGGAPRVFVLNGSLVAQGMIEAAQSLPVANFFVDDDLDARGGVKVAFEDFDGDGVRELSVQKLGEEETRGVRIYARDALLQSSGKAPANIASPLSLERAVTLLGTLVG